MKLSRIFLVLALGALLFGTSCSTLQHLDTTGNWNFGFSKELDLWGFKFYLNQHQHVGSYNDLLQLFNKTEEKDVSVTIGSSSHKGKMIVDNSNGTAYVGIKIKHADGSKEKKVYVIENYNGFSNEAYYAQEIVDYELPDGQALPVTWIKIQDSKLNDILRQFK